MSKLLVAAYLTILMQIFLMSPSTWAQGFEYPRRVSIAAAKANVDVDLLKFHRLEIKKAGRLAMPARNKKLFAQLNEYKISSKDRAPAKPKAEAINEAQAKIIHDALQSHPIVSVEGSAKYDTRRRMVGYCFGRAAFVHWELLRRGVDPRAIAKLFVIGDLFYENTIWEFHVSTIVRATDGGWWAIDGYGAAPLKLEAWSDRVKTWSHKNTKNLSMRFYFADAVKFLPLPGAYSDERLFTAIYKGFFTDIIRWFNEHPLKENESFSPTH